MDKKQEFKINVGGSSIILIIVVFALSIFAVLSIKASNSDLVLAKKTREAISQYYHADSDAEEFMSELDLLLQERDSKLLHTELEAMNGYARVNEESDTIGTISYSCAINDYATLEVELAYDLAKAEGPLYDIRNWKINQKAVGEYDFSNFQFWDGTIEDE